MIISYRPEERRTFDSIRRKAAARSEGAVTLAQGLVLAEGAGEAVKELRTYLGHSRKSQLAGTPEQLLCLADEVADVVITAQVLADLVGFDLEDAVAAKLQAIKERGGI